MGVESGEGGGGGERVPGQQISGGRPRNLDISVSFWHVLNFEFPNIVKIKWPKSEEKINF